MYNAIDSTIDTLGTYAVQQGTPIECSKGCEWCCNQPVYALDYELDFLKQYMLSNFPISEKKALKKRALEKKMKLDKLEKDKLLNAKHPCPLLKNGICLAYNARPMACRIYLSSNVKSCLKFYDSPEDKKNYPALLDMPLRLGRMMNEGFKAALKLNGIESEEFRIEEKLI